MSGWLSGFPRIEPVIFTALVVGLAIFFVISGYHKLFNADRRKTLTTTLITDGIPFVKFNAWFVPCVELVCGFLIGIGFLTSIAAGVLIILLTVAIVTDGIKRINGFHPIDKFDWLDDLLYLSEFWYVALLFYIIAHGPGPFSIDHLLFGIR